MADKKSLAEEYKEIMVAWGKASLDKLDKSYIAGEISDGYEKLRQAIEDKYNSILNSDAEKLLQDKYDNAVAESRGKVEYISNILATEEMSKEDREGVETIKKLYEDTLALSEEGLKEQLVSGAKEMLEQAKK